MDAVVADATKGYPIVSAEGQIVAYRRSAAAQKLYLAYALGTPRKQPAESWLAFDPEELDTLDGCRAAAISIMQAQIAGKVDDEAANAYRQTVDLAMKSLQFQASQDQELRLAEAGAESIILDAADPDIAGQIQRAVDAINAPSEDDDD